ncbi:peptide deformylase [Candidatus Daviesbacteria bacterium]|nr:peptide deformylase [Candidatus Daviesbacteria bacterium]
MINKFSKPHLFLGKKAPEIPLSEISSKNIKTIYQKMLKIAYGEQKNRQKPIMVGLAAPQIGIFKRIILVDVKTNGKGKIGDLRIYINPEIIWASKKEGEWYEGCYSLPEVCGIVSRSTSVKVRAYTLKTPGIASVLPPRWDMVEEKHSDYVARIFQHEIDHLDGKFFVERIKNPDHLHHVKKEEFPLYRDLQAWRNWPKKYPLP